MNIGVLHEFKSSPITNISTISHLSSSLTKKDIKSMITHRKSEISNSSSIISSLPTKQNYLGNEVVYGSSMEKMGKKHSKMR